MAPNFSTRPVWVEVSLSAIGENIRSFKKIIGPRCLLMAVVKANGYGHGAVEVSKKALKSGANYLGVAMPEEGVELREAGITAPILVLAEPSPEQVPLVFEYDLETALYTPELAKKLSEESCKKSREVKVHLKIDTGMNRAGVLFSNFSRFLEKIKDLKGLKVVGLFSHLACADEPFREANFKQIDLFEQAKQMVKKFYPEIAHFHLTNTAGTLFLPSARQNMVRLGLGIYGLYPNKEARKAVSLKPVLSWKARVALVKEVPAGSGVSYCHTFITQRPTRLALVPVGYADGLKRALSNKGEFLIGNQRASIVGRVCMDQVMVDVTKVGKVKIGDEVVIIGSQGKEKITAEDLAEKLGTINYEIVSSIGPRVGKVYLD